VTTESGRAACHGFGLAIDLLDGIVCDGLGSGHGAGSPPSTVVRLGRRGHIDDIWQSDAAETTRELRAGEQLIFSVAHLADVGYLLTMPAFGRFLIDEAGASVICEPSVAEWSTALLVQALPLACTLRGYEPFHASGVVLDGRALIISAPVLSGKSSLAAHLVASGALLLSDDVVAVDASGGDLRAHPGGRWLRLRPPADAWFADAGGGGRRPAGSEDGRPRYEAPLAAEPAPLAAVYLLKRDGAGAAAVSRVRDAGLALLAATYNLSVRTPQRLRRQLELAHRLSSEVGVFRVAMSADSDAHHHASVVRDHFTSEIAARP
jgi:hypothetical protein